MNIRPLHDRLVVKREAEERKSPAALSFPIPRPRSRYSAKCLRSAKAKFCRAARSARSI